MMRLTVPVEKKAQTISVMAVSSLVLLMVAVCCYRRMGMLGDGAC